MVKTVQVTTAARQGKEAAEGALVRALIHASKATSADDLDVFMDHVDALNNVSRRGGAFMPFTENSPRYLMLIYINLRFSCDLY